MSGDRFRTLEVNTSQWHLEPWLEENVPEGWVIVSWTVDPKNPWNITLVIRNGIDG